VLLKPGAEFDVALQLDPAIHAKGLVREIAPEAEDTTRTRRTRLTLVNPPEALRLGAVITASTSSGETPLIRLPSSAVRVDGAKAFVWIIDVPTGKVSSRSVTIAEPLVVGGTVTVTEGINPGDRVVTAGVNTLEDGQTVRIDQESVI